MGIEACTIRERQEDWERQILSPMAALSVNSRGRARSEEKCSIRTDYQRDRDRILYSKAFRRLKHKTQVFLSPEGDHFRTRLTHTLEVSQISRSIARALRLNEDLTEAISLGHDLGHAPFGHAGELALDELIRSYDSKARYCHYEQSLRVVDLLEEGHGLNLTFEVRDGILKHSKGRQNLSRSHSRPLSKSDSPVTQEGELVRIADRMAYINHDIDDALRARVITFDDLPQECLKILGTKISERIGTMVVDVIETSLKAGRIAMSSRISDVVDTLKEFMFRNVYIDSPAKGEEVKAKRMIGHLFRYLMEHPEQLPPHPDIFNLENIRSRARAVCDHVAGMTDRYAISVYGDIFIPKVWAL